MSLTRKETGILEYLLLHRGAAGQSGGAAGARVGQRGRTASATPSACISPALRKKLRAALGYDPIRNRIGEGYVMEEQT